MPVRTQTVTAGPRRARVGLARGLVVALLAAVGIVVAAQPAAAASATRLDAGGSHTCVVVSGGTVSCWGWNVFGQLGDGTTTNRSTPVAVSGLPAGVTITQVSTGNSHTCAVSSAGAVYCWGNNDYGQLGDTSTTDRTTPVAVTGLTGVTQVSAGNEHTCARTSTGAVYCWGYNYYGQLGYGTTNNQPSPVAVTGLTGVTITQVSAGWNDTCARTSTGAAYCWGNNDYGQLGNGNLTSYQPSPVAVTGLTGVTQVSTGGLHTCALSSTGAAYCWGANGVGRLGNGNTANQHAPVAVSALPTTPPGAPTGVTATAGNAQATVSWTAPSYLGSGPLTGYTATAEPSGATCTTTSTSCTITGLTNGTSYTVTVVAHGDSDSPAGTASAAVVPYTLPGAPTHVTATAGNGQATVSWTAPASLGGRPLTGYTATAEPGGASCTTTTTSCTITGLTGGTSYTFTVFTRSSVGDSPTSVASTPQTPYTLPGAPTHVTATARNRQATVSWTAPASLGTGTLTGYTATADPGGATCTTSTTSCTITGLANGTAYTFTVITRTTAGDSSASSASTAVTPAVPAAPPLPDQVPAGDGPLSSSHTATFTTTSRTTTLTGTGFAPNTPITVGIHSTPQVLTTTLTDSTGAFSVEVTIPTGYTGAHTLLAVGLGPDQATLRTLTLPITIAADPASPASSTGGLAVTGRALTTTIGLALALLAIGTAAIITVRRRRPHFTTDSVDLD
jgi:hypothetical protein